MVQRGRMGKPFFSSTNTYGDRDMKPILVLTASIFAILLPAPATAQIAPSSKGHEILKLESGDWNAKTKLYMTPGGIVEEPEVSTGKESNKMIGPFWLVSDFKGTFGGMKFTGHGTFGYDSKTKKYSGIWIDSFGPYETKMIGSYDEASKTMTYETIGIGMDGQPMKGRNVVVYHSDDKRTMTMYMTMPGETKMVRAMEIEYERAK